MLGKWLIVSIKLVSDVEFFYFIEKIYNFNTYINNKSKLMKIKLTKKKRKVGLI